MAGVFNKNIQEMEATGILVNLRRKWFKSPQKCSLTQTSGDTGVPLLPADPFIPLAFQTVMLVGAALLLAAFNRIFFKSQAIKRKLKNTVRKMSQEADKMTRSEKEKGLNEKKAETGVAVISRNSVKRSELRNGVQSNVAVVSKESVKKIKVVA